MVYILYIYIFRGFIYEQIGNRSLDLITMVSRSPKSGYPWLSHGWVEQPQLLTTC